MKTGFFDTMFLVYQPTFEVSSVFLLLFSKGCMTDPKIRKKEKVTMTSVKKKRKGMVRSTFARRYVRFKYVVKISVRKAF